MKENIQKTALTSHFRALGTRISLTVFGTLDQTVLEKSEELVSHYEDILTVNRDHSQLMSVNHAAGKFPVQVDAPVYQLTKLAVEKSRADFGFNAAIGPLVKLWHIGFKDARVPSEQQISERLSLIDPGQIELNDANQSIFLKKAGMEIDLGAIAKGYIADRIQDLWHAYGITHGIINLGGNLLMVGKPPHHRDGLWRIGLRSPFSENDEPIAVVTMPPCSAVTSGIYERRLTSGQKSYHHILDSNTGYPRENNLNSVTVFSRKSVTAEIETTRLFFAGGPLPDYPFEQDVLGAAFITKDCKIELSGIAPGQIRLLDGRYQIVH
ncbi:FAD:protein FMN transferase [Ligilactobacillus sp.]|uniref:FAD:protein FMN transferase n=1 Tax=Ligilactobacillus sp. TaxID=2767921 RepID=UPI002FE3112D